MTSDRNERISAARLFFGGAGDRGISVKLHTSGTISRQISPHSWLVLELFVVQLVLAGNRPKLCNPGIILENVHGT